MIQIPERGVLKIAKAKATTVDGVATVLLKVPGTAGAESQRIIESGIGWFSSCHLDDSFEVYITDEDNILGYGAGAIIDGYTDTDVPTANKGWFIPAPKGFIELQALGGLGRLPGGLYLKIIATKGDASSDTFRCNIKWGIVE